MRILHIVPAYVPAWRYGGPVQVVHELTRELAMRGHEVEVWTTDLFATRAGAVEQLGGARVRRFRTPVQSTRVQVPVGCCSAVRRFAGGFDIVHLHEHRTTLNAGFAACSSAALPYVLTPHGTSILQPLRPLKQGFDLLVGRNLLKAADAILTLNDFEAKLVKSLGAPDFNVRILPNGVRLEDFPVEIGLNSFRETHSVPRRAPLLLFMGRLHAMKAPRLALDAFARSSQRDAILVFAGPNDGQETPLRRAAARTGVAGQVRFVGMLRGREKLEALHAADAFITPQYSGFPVAFLEAAAARKPIITTSLGDEMDWLHEAGVVAEPTIDAVAGAIARVLSDDQMRTRLGRRGRQLVEEKFTWKRIVDRLEVIYREAALSRAVTR